jgi:hypothetical protein
VISICFITPTVFAAVSPTQPTGSRQKTRASGDGKEIGPILKICWEDTMNRSEYLGTTAWVKGEKRQWSPTTKIILAFIIGALALSPAILGIYWELLLPR